MCRPSLTCTRQYMPLLMYQYCKESERWLCCLQKGGKTTGGDVLVSDHIPKVKVGFSAEASPHASPDKQNASPCMHDRKGLMTYARLVCKSQNRPISRNFYNPLISLL